MPEREEIKDFLFCFSIKLLLPPQYFSYILQLTKNTDVFFFGFKLFNNSFFYVNTKGLNNQKEGGGNKTMKGQRVGLLAVSYLEGGR